jgi:AmpE protein
MTFIIIFLALVIERYFHWQHLRQWRWFNYYNHWLVKAFGYLPAKLRLAGTVLIPVFIVGLVELLLGKIGSYLLEMLFGLIILIYCLGPTNLWVEIYSRKLEVSADSMSINKSCAEIFLSAQERIFAILFWFVILGPIGAVLYRLLTLYKHEVDDVNNLMRANYYLSLLDWLPARGFVLILALVGNFTAVMTVSKRYLTKPASFNTALISEGGLAALHLPPSTELAESSVITRIIELLDRVFIMSLVILAVGVFIL